MHELEPLPSSELPDGSPDQTAYKDNLWVSCRRAAYPGNRQPQENSGVYAGERPLEPLLYGPLERGVFAPIDLELTNVAGEVSSEKAVEMARGFGARDTLERELEKVLKSANAPLREVYGLVGAGVPEDWVYTHDPVGEGKSHPTSLPSYARRHYTVEPLRWGFEEGTFEPFWQLHSSGMPNFAVRKDCFLPPNSGRYQLCSAYPLERRELVHGLLHVRSVPFVLGDGDLTFRSNGGEVGVPAMPRATEELAAVGEGSLGVALTRVRDGYRVLTLPTRSRRFWMREMMNSTQLRDYVGEKFVLDIIDYRCCDFGWMAVDSFIVPRAWVQITSVEPFVGPRSGGTRIEIAGKNFGSSVDGLTVFVGEGECTELAMTQRGSLICRTPPGEGVGVTVSVVVGDYDRNLRHGPFGGHQSGHCGEESREFPFSDCRPGLSDPRWGMPLRGFTYADPPVFVSSPTLEALEDSVYMYTVAARDPDAAFEKSGVHIRALELPPWLIFDEFTSVLSGVPLRSDVAMPRSTMEPARPRKHRVVMEATDYVYVVRQTFDIEVQLLLSLLSETVGEFHHPSAEEHRAVRDRALAGEYHLRAGGRVGMPPEDAAGIAAINGRGTTEASLRTLLNGLLMEPRLKVAEIYRVIEAAERAGYGLALRDVTARARAAVAAQQAQDAASRIDGPVQRGKHFTGWHAQLEGALFDGGAEGAQFIDHTPQHMRLLLATPCTNEPSNFTVSCAFEAYHREHVLDVRFGRGGVTIKAVKLDPLDMPFADLARRAVSSNDIIELVRATSDRAARYAKRYEEYAAIPDAFGAEWTPGTSLLTLHLPRLHEHVERALRGEAPWYDNLEADDEQIISVTLDIDSSYPYPTPPQPYATRVRVVRADGIPYHLAEGLDAMSNELTEHVFGSLSQRLGALHAMVSERASRCLNDCTRHGWCNTTAFPPRCECYEGYTFDDCSHLLCPGNCTGNGACDDRRVCEDVPETGERRCTGGSGKCACYAPFFGADCSLRACPRNRLVVPGANFSAGEDHYRDRYEEYGRLLNVTLIPAVPAPFLGGGKLRSANSGGALQEMPYYGDPAQLAYLDSSQGDILGGGVLPLPGGVANAELYGGHDPSLPADLAVVFLQFYDAADAERARLDMYAELASAPSRGVPERARLFAQEAAALERQEDALLARFGRAPQTCNGRGACDYHAGECLCAYPHFGASCEFTHCPNSCSGHGLCKFESGVCACDEFYDRHDRLGCSRRQMGLASTLCEDEALDRRSPLALSCYMGAPLGSPMPCADQPGGCDGRFARVESGVACPDCSGSLDPLYRDISVSHPSPPPSPLDPENNLLFPASQRRPKARGIGAPSGTVISFRLDELRVLGLEFRGLGATAGIVQDDPSCGACNATVPQCGARFEVFVDGRLAWDAVVATSLDLTIELDPAARNLTLVTSEYRPAFTRFLTKKTPDNPFGVYMANPEARADYWLDEAPRTALTPVEQSWCSLAAWQDARLIVNS